MLSFHAHLKVFVATAPCDLRASFIVLAKRLEEGCFNFPPSAGEPSAKIRLAPQALVVDGRGRSQTGRTPRVVRVRVSIVSFF
jgi:hypothetical protein